MNPLSFSWPERLLALIAGIFNLIIGLAFFLLPELQFPLWPVSISPILTRFIGAIIIGNGVGAVWLSTEQEWARVRFTACLSITILLRASEGRR